MRIKDVMTHPPVTCRTDMHMDAVVRLMSEFDCGMVVLVDRAGRLAGVITDRDVCLAMLKYGQTLADTRISDVVENQVFSCGADDRLESAIGLMRDLLIRRMPVTDDAGIPIGVLSIDDVARVAYKAKFGSLDREFIRAMAAIGRPKAAAA